MGKALGDILSSNKFAGFFEIVIVFAAAAAVIFAGLPFAGEDPLARQLVIFVANILMLALVWAGMRLRGQRVDYLGITFRFAGWWAIGKGFTQSLIVLVFGIAAFIFGAIVMANITGIPEQADVSGYNYLKGNLPMLLLSLASIYFISSFGEEVIYRGFLINRVEDLFGGGRKALVVAVAVSALMFGLAHFGWGIAGVVQTTFMGLALALSFLFFRRNLWILIAAHAYMDTALIVPLYFG